jgi:exonuclease III
LLAAWLGVEHSRSGKSIGSKVARALQNRSGIGSGVNAAAWQLRIAPDAFISRHRHANRGGMHEFVVFADRALAFATHAGRRLEFLSATTTLIDRA